MPINTESIRQRFSAIRWHDSVLHDPIFLRVGKEQRVRIPLELDVRPRVPGSSHEPIYELHTITFMRTNRIKMDVDLECKRDCSDQVFSGEMIEPSVWKDKIVKEDPYNDYSTYLHFRIELCAPSGTIEILAEDFELVRVVAPLEQ